MSEIKQIKIAGTWYPVKDETARNILAGKADLASPTFTGIPKAPTAAAGTNTTQLATTAFVQAHTHGGIEVRPNYTVSTTDLTDGVSTLASGKLYFYYEV